MPLPHAIARFNKRVTNRFIEPLARRSNGFAVVHHVGRRSGKRYTTPVNLFRLDDDAIVSLTYGLRADWLKNVLAGGGTIQDLAGRRTIESARIVDRTAAWPALPLVVRAALRVLRVRDFLRLSLVAEHGLEAPGGEPPRRSDPEVDHNHDNVLVDRRVRPVVERGNPPTR